jgi:hypothetical protein
MQMNASSEIFMLTFTNLLPENESNPYNIDADANRKSGNLQFLGSSEVAVDWLAVICRAKHDTEVATDHDFDSTYYTEYIQLLL